jgi:PAS domain S-box-containing protein
MYECEAVNQTLQGRTINVLLRWSLLASDHTKRSRALISIVDITERKLAEEKIRKNEEFIRSILDTVDEGFIVIDRDYRILTANKAYCGQVSRPCGEVIGRHCFEISHKINRPCYEEGEECSVRQVFATGEPHAALHKHEDRGGHMLFVETKGFPIRDASGNITSVIETINNITEKHLLEEERLKTQKLESIGTLAGGIAHDFNNLLQGIFGSISMARLTIDRKEKSLAMLEQAEKALHQSVNLTTQLLTFSKGGKPVKKLIDLRPVIENSAKFTLSGSRSDFRLIIPEDLWQTEADEGQLGQVIQNIVLNADQALPIGGTVRVTAANMAEGAATLPPGLAQGDYVVIAIQDAGVGIPEQYLSKIFDPYFTTKEKGSGLGLATSYSIVRNHGGMIDVRTKSGEGSTFMIYLPAIAGKGRVEAELQPQELSARRRARILVMDDEEILRDLSSELLGMLGHDVEVAKHGQEALEKYQGAMAARSPFDIVILDLTIRGGMGGSETIQKLLEIDPAVRAIVSSGYSDDLAIANHLQHGFKAYLKKPCSIAELHDIVNSLLP